MSEITDNFADSDSTRRRPPARADRSTPTVSPVADAALEQRRVPRVALLQRILDRNAPLIVVLQAPAGHGKSTTLRQIHECCERQQVRCASLRLDQSDNDQKRHTARLQALLNALCGTPVADADGRPGGDAGLSDTLADWVLDRLALDPSPAALFLDEFEVVTDAAVLRLWRELLVRIPPHCRVFVASRAIPDIGLPRLQVLERVALVDARELRFSPDEMLQFFRANGEQRITAEQLDRLHGLTEGWPAAIQLLRLRLSRTAVDDLLDQLEHHPPQQLGEYLTDCVIGGLSNEIRHFLRRTCVLERLGPQICNLLTGRSDSLNILRRLEKQGLFVGALDECGHWFRYHSLLSGHLREKLLSEDPAMFRQLHRDACGWFREQGMHEPAIHHAIVANEMGMAAEILEGWCGRLILQGELNTVDRWYECVPIREVVHRPELCRRVAWALIFMGRPDKLAHLKALSAQVGDADPFRISDGPALVFIDDLPGAFRLSEQISDPGGAIGEFTCFELAAVSNLGAMRHITVGNLEAAELALAASAHYQRQIAAHFSGGYATCLACIVLMLRGNATQAVEQLSAVLSGHARVLESSYASPPLAACLIWALYETDQVVEALAAATAYREIIFNCSAPDFLSLGVTAMVRTLYAADRPAEARALLVEAEMKARRNQWPRLIPYFESMRAGSAGSGNRPRAAPPGSALPGRWLPIGDLVSGTWLDDIHRVIDQEDYASATSRIGELHDQHPGNRWLHVQLGLAKAWMLSRRGLHQHAMREFSSATELLFRSGYRRMLIDQYKRFAPLIERYLENADRASAAALSQFVRSCLPRNGRPSASRSTSAEPLPHGVADHITLTHREQQVAVCLSQRMSNKEIAQSIYISENTVKFHVKNIFEKLQVRTRGEAYAALKARLRDNAFAMNVVSPAGGDYPTATSAD